MEEKGGFIFLCVRNDGTNKNDILIFRPTGITCLPKRLPLSYGHIGADKSNNPYAHKMHEQLYIPACIRLPHFHNMPSE